MALGRALILAVALYTTADFSSPVVLGAFVFDPGKSVDGIRDLHARHQARLAAGPPAPGPAPVVLASRPDRPACPRSAAHPVPPPPRPRSAPVAEPRPAVEDH
jgi:hypothetical protein